MKVSNYIYAYGELSQMIFKLSWIKTILLLELFAQTLVRNSIRKPWRKQFFRSWKRIFLGKGEEMDQLKMFRFFATQISVNRMFWRPSIHRAP